MDSSDLLKIIFLVILLILSAFFSASETALLSSNKMKMRSRAEAGDKKAARVLKLCEDKDRMLSAILIGNNIANLASASLATTIAMDIWGSKSVAIATGILTLLVLVFGEVTPKAIATRNSDEMSRKSAGVIDVMATIFKPVILLVNVCADTAMRIVGIDPDKGSESMTEEELRTIVEVSSEEGVIESDEKEMITNVIDFGDTVVKDIMIPVADMVCIDVEADYDELIEVFRSCRYTRIPVYEGSELHIIGIMNMKDLLLKDGGKKFSIRDYMRKAFYTYENKNVKALMPEMKKALANVAIVLDEYGSTSGMVTIEDMLEEIFGEIRDEFDYDETENIIEVKENEYIVSGSTKPEELNERFGLDLEEDKWASISGVVMDMLGHIPNKGEEISSGRCRMVVESMDNMRIKKVRLYIVPSL